MRIAFACPVKAERNRSGWRAVSQRPSARVGPTATIELNDRELRAETAKTLELPRRERTHWARNRRVCQTVKLQIGEASVVVANMHLTHFDQRLAEAEFQKASSFVDQLAGSETPSLLAGDLNIPGKADAAFAGVAAAGYTRAAPGIDHLLGRRMTLWRGPAPLDDSVRTRNGLRLSDHPIIEAEFELT